MFGIRDSVLSSGTSGTSSTPKIVIEELQNLKNSANKFFSEGRFDQAVIGYSFAIKQIQEAVTPSNNSKVAPDPIRIAQTLKTSGRKSAEAASIMAVLYCNRAQAYLKLAKNNKAFVDADIASRIDPQMFKALYRKAVAASKINKFYDAKVALEAALQIDPSSDEAKSLLGELRFNMGVSQQPMSF